MSDKQYTTVARFPGVIKKVQTISTGDGAFRITIDIPENALEGMVELMKLQASPQVCAIIVATENKPTPHVELEPSSESDREF